MSNAKSRSNKVTGPSVSVYFNGETGEADVSTQCDLNRDYQWRCPFVTSESAPPEEGAQCFVKDGCECRSVAARMAALKLAKSAVHKAMRKLEDEEGEE